MKTRLRKCTSCGTYTLSDKCPKCDLPTGMPMPGRYSPQDKYGKYRRAMKESKG